MWRSGFPDLYNTWRRLLLIVTKSITYLYSMRFRNSTVLVSLFAIALIHSPVTAQSLATELPPVLVTPSAETQTLKQAYDKRSASPGHVSVIPAESYSDGAVLGISDALSGMPGVYTQNPSGQTSARISIRGSG